MRRIHETAIAVFAVAANCPAQPSTETASRQAGSMKFVFTARGSNATVRLGFEIGCRHAQAQSRAVTRALEKNRDRAFGACLDYLTKLPSRTLRDRTHRDELVGRLGDEISIGLFPDGIAIVDGIKLTEFFFQGQPREGEDRAKARPRARMLAAERARLATTMFGIAQRCESRAIALAYYSRAIHHPDTATRLRIVSILGQAAVGQAAGDSGSFVIDALLTCLNDRETRIVQEAITAIGIKPALPEPCLARLRQLATDPRRSIAATARAVLANRHAAPTPDH